MPKPNFDFSSNKEKHSFSDTWKKLIIFCKSYLPTIILAMVLATGGTVFTILGPNKIGDFSSEIGKAISYSTDGIPVLGSIDMEAVTNIALTLLLNTLNSISLSEDDIQSLKATNSSYYKFTISATYDCRDSWDIPKNISFYLRNLGDLHIFDL